MDLYRKKKDGWSPYLAGALVGLLAIASAWLTTVYMGKTNYLGASTTFVRAAGLVEEGIVPEHAAGNAYFTKTKIKVDWQFMLVLGILPGALIASLSDRSFKLEAVPPLWQQYFGPSVAKRGLAAFFGGIVAMIGARLADGCPSGHGLSGLMQLSASSFVAMACFFGIGIVVASLIYKGRRP